jgi:hypothetical protein
MIFAISVWLYLAEAAGQGTLWRNHIPPATCITWDAAGRAQPCAAAPAAAIRERR